MAELRELRTGRDDVQALRNEVAALRSELGKTRALLSGANAERIDRALEAEIQESQAAPEHPATSAGSDTVAERPSTGTGDSTAPESPGDGTGASDGLLVRAAQWVERRLRR